MTVHGMVSGRALLRGIKHTLCVGTLCGTYSVLLDTDHVIRCLPRISWDCITSQGVKDFHGWIGLGLGIYCGLLCTCFAGRFLRLVDNPAGVAYDDHKIEER